MKLLLVEDEPDLARSISDYLGDCLMDTDTFDFIFGITYTYTDGRHKVTVGFENAERIQIRQVD